MASRKHVRNFNALRQKFFCRNGRRNLRIRAEFEKFFGSDFDDIILNLFGIKMRSHPCTRFSSTTNTLGVLVQNVVFLGGFGKCSRKTHVLGVYAKSICRRT